MIWFLIQEQGLFNWIEVDSHLSPRYLKPENFLPRQRHRRAWFNTDEEVDTSNMLSTNLSCFASSFFWPLPVSLLFDLLLVFINLIRVFHLLSVVYNRKGETFSIFENHSREKILQMLRFIWDLDESVLFFLRFHSTFAENDQGNNTQNRTDWKIHASMSFFWESGIVWCATDISSTSLIKEEINGIRSRGCCR